MNPDNPLVIYHANCADGFTCAWLFHLVWPDADFVPANYGDPPPDVAVRHVYILDFSYKRQVMDSMIQLCKSMCVLDHHKTAEKELAGIASDTAQKYLNLGGGGVHIAFDMEKSGGRLAWEFLWDLGKLPEGMRQEYGRESPPWLVAYTEDRDLWRWKLSNSKEINACIRSYPFDFDEWDHWARIRANMLGIFVAEGSAILRAQQQIVDQHVKNAVEILAFGQKILCVNATVLMSEIGEALAAGRPFSMTYFRRGDGKYVYSLRSNKDGVDVSEIAKSVGGGGHRNAAGFTADIAP